MEHYVVAQRFRKPAKVVYLRPNNEGWDISIKKAMVFPSRKDAIAARDQMIDAADASDTGVELGVFKVYYNPPPKSEKGGK
jgi:hypothetical protein